MENQFSLTDDHLKVLINSFSDWGDKNKDEKKYPVDHREKGKKLKETLLNIEYLNKVSDEELVQNVFDYSRTLEGPAYIRLGMPRISGQISELRRNLKYLIETQDDPFKKAKEILEGEYKIPIFAKAFWTPLFQAQFPDKLPNWNNKTENFFKKLGIDLKTRKINVEEKYRLLSDAFLYLKKLDPKQDFYNLNHLMHYGTEIDEGSNLIASMTKESQVNAFDTNPQCSFSKKTFELLQELHEQPYREFYNQYREDFKNHLEYPFKKLFKPVAERFSPLMKEHLELNKGLFSRITKNDYGKGGAWSHYWGAFYPKGGKRIEDAQLSIWINKDFFQFGFYIGAYGVEQKKRFLLNCRNNLSALENILAEPFSDPKFIYGDWDEKLTDGDIPEDLKEITWKKWLTKPDDKGINVGILMTRNELLSLPEDKLIDEIVSTFTRLFPLMILTFSENPLPLITEFLDLDQEDHEINPVYPLDLCAHDVGFEANLLERWVRAIERKRQAVIYGPPGTGKTFIAEHLAKHLIGGGDGFFQIVQFHPAYAYEDFIQGIRPKSLDGGGLHYPVVPGLFLKFCEKAKSFQDRCVLIIDEINRANLARVFGELMYLLEYRTQEVPLASGGYLRIPDNVRIIGTMNTADRSIALVDHALRRRFAFLSLYPNYEVLSRYHQETSFNAEPLINVLKRLNKQIADRHYEVGISFFLREDMADQIEDIWVMEIEPYLEEYFFDQQDKVDSFRWDKIGKDILV